MQDFERRFYKCRPLKNKYAVRDSRLGMIKMLSKLSIADWPNMENRIPMPQLTAANQPGILCASFGSNILDSVCMEA